MLKNLNNGLYKTGTFGTNQKYFNLKRSFINGKLYNEFDYIRIEIDGENFKFIYDFAEIFTDLFFSKKILPNELSKWRYEKV